MINRFFKNSYFMGIIFPCMAADMPANEMPKCSTACLGAVSTFESIPEDMEFPSDQLAPSPVVSPLQVPRKSVSRSSSSERRKSGGFIKISPVHSPRGIVRRSSSGKGRDLMTERPLERVKSQEKITSELIFD